MRVPSLTKSACPTSRSRGERRGGQAFPDARRRFLGSAAASPVAPRRNSISINMNDIIIISSIITIKLVVVSVSGSAFRPCRAWTASQRAHIYCLSSSFRVEVDPNVRVIQSKEHRSGSSATQRLEGGVASRAGAPHDAHQIIYYIRLTSTILDYHILSHTMINILNQTIIY